MLVSRNRAGSLGLASLIVGNVPGLLAKLDHCVIHVSDWTVSNPFYRDVLGAELIDRGRGAWAYRFGTEQLNVHGPGAVGDPSPGFRLHLATATCALSGTATSRTRSSI